MRLRPADDEGDVLIRFRVQLVGVLSLQHLAVERHHAQRLLQIVTGGIRELIQIVVGLPQRFVGLEQLLGALRDALLQRGIQLANRFVGLLALGDVANRGGDQQSFFGLQRAQADFDRKSLLVLADAPRVPSANWAGRGTAWNPTR